MLPTTLEPSEHLLHFATKDFWVLSTSMDVSGQSVVLKVDLNSGDWKSLGELVPGQSRTPRTRRPKCRRRKRNQTLSQQNVRLQQRLRQLSPRHRVRQMHLQNET